MHALCYIPDTSESLHVVLDEHCFVAVETSGLMQWHACISTDFICRYVSRAGAGSRGGGDRQFCYVNGRPVDLPKVCVVGLGMPSISKGAQHNLRVNKAGVVHQQNQDAW